MSSSESFDSRYAALGLGMYGVGNGIVVNYPKTQFTWSFYNSPTTRGWAPTATLKSYLGDSKIGSNPNTYGYAPGSNYTRPGTLQISQQNHAAAVAAEASRIKNQFGSSISGEVLSKGEAALRMRNLNGNARTLDVGVRIRSFWTGSVDRFFEVKTGQMDLKGTRGGTPGVEAPADAANLKALNAKNAGIRIAGQALRIGGSALAVGSIGYDGYVTCGDINQKLSAGNMQGAGLSAAQFVGRQGGGIVGGVAAGALLFGAGGAGIGTVAPGVGTLILGGVGVIAGGIAGAYLGEEGITRLYNAVVNTSFSPIRQPLAPTNQPGWNPSTNLDQNLPQPGQPTNQDNGNSAPAGSPSLGNAGAMQGGYGSPDGLPAISDPASVGAYELGPSFSPNGLRRVYIYMAAAGRVTEIRETAPPTQPNR